MRLLQNLKNYIVRKRIYTDDRSDIFKISDNEYLFINKVVRATIKTYEYNNEQFLIFNVRNYNSSDYLINFAIVYDFAINLEQFIIDHCKENPVFMIHEMDLPSVISSRIFMIKSQDNNILPIYHPVFIDRIYLNRDAYEFSLTIQTEHLHHILWRANNFNHAIKFKFDNEHCFFIGEVEYKIVTIKKKKISRYISKFTLSCVNSNNIMNILTVYDINSVVCVLKNVFDLVDLGMDKEWLLYTDGNELDQVINPSLRYLDAYIDIFKTPLLFHKNSPCMIKKDKQNVELQYIDGYRSSKVNLNISRTACHDVSGVYTKITKPEMNIFFSSIVNHLSTNVFKLCARSPSSKLLHHLHHLGFEDCKAPIECGIIEVLKMHDY